MLRRGELLSGDVQPDGSCVWPSSDAGNDVVMSVLTVGTFLSFLPLSFAILSARSSYGVSIFSFLLVCLCNWTSTLGVALQNWQRVLCCDRWSSLQCSRSLIPPLLVAAGCAAFPALFFAALYFEQTPPADFQSPSSRPSSRASTMLSGVTKSGKSVMSRALSAAPQQLRKSGCGCMCEAVSRLCNVQSRAHAAAMVVLQAAVIAATTGVAAALLKQYGAGSDEVDLYAKGLNLFAGICQAVSWLPQIVQTCRLRDVGSLSILTLLIQAPGSAAVTASMIGDGQDITSVTQYAVCFIIQGVLLIECLYFIALQRPPDRSRVGWIVCNGLLRECQSDPTGAGDGDAGSESDGDGGAKAPPLLEPGGAACEP